MKQSKELVKAQIVPPVKAHPFLKWVGGKQRLLPELLARAPKKFECYHEPFLGGGALFFALKPKRAVLSDINPDLYYTYRALRDNVERVIQLLWDLIDEREKKGHLAHYLKVRKQKRPGLTECAVAARMIYLNKTCFNGLWRVNRKGEFNVPIGKSKSPPTICDEENLRACSAALATADIHHAGFENVLTRNMGRGDFVYFDPPYVPVSRPGMNPSFTAYSKEGFGPPDQKRLSEIMSVLKNERRAHVLLSNAGSPKVKELYAGFKIEEVGMRRNINCQRDGRGEVVEYLIR
jgi:DNA adenine methylase